MNALRDIDPDELADMRDEARARLMSTSCRCGGDMPGICPGPGNCPMCEEMEDEETAGEEE